VAEPKTAKQPARRKKRPEGAPRSRGVAPDALGSGWICWYLPLKGLVLKASLGLGKSPQPFLAVFMYLPQMVAGYVPPATLIGVVGGFIGVRTWPG